MGSNQPVSAAAAGPGAVPVCSEQMDSAASETGVGSHSSSSGLSTQRVCSIALSSDRSK